MKRIFALALAAAMVLSLVACGGTPSSSDASSGNTDENTGSIHSADSSLSEEGDADSSGEGDADPVQTDDLKDEFLAQAEEVNMWQEIGPKTFENPEEAKELYCGKILKVTGRLEGFSGDNLMMQYYDLNLSTEWEVNIILHFPAEDDSHLRDTYMGQNVVIVGQMGEDLEEVDGSYFYTMDKVYLVQDREEFVCVLSPGVGSNYLAEVEGLLWSLDVEFRNDQQEIPLDTEVTISGVRVGEQIFDAVIVT